MTVHWDLDSIFEGGSGSAALAQFLADLSSDLAGYEAEGVPPPLSEETRASWINGIQRLFELSARLDQASSFINCLASQDVRDDKALQLRTRVAELAARRDTLWAKVSAAFARQEDEAWGKLTAETDLNSVAFRLNEERDLARQRMEPELEALANELAADGYHAWNQLYQLISGDKEVVLDGQTLSLGQLQNRYRSHPERAVRERSFELFEKAWAELVRSCALALNYQAGYRLTLYRHRGWDSVLSEPLTRNRLSAETLEAMWHVVDAKSEKLLDYFAAKARLFGVDKLSWFDVPAPVGELKGDFSFAEAADFVVDTIREFNPDIADFCRMAINHQWIEAENRPGKRAGAYCTFLHLSGQSRVFMTFDGSFSGVRTLAHELGHGYHQSVMRDLPYGARSYAMAVAETASTFNESIVYRAVLKNCSDQRERLAILAATLNNAATFLMDIRSRYGFETAFFEQRAKGQLSVDELSDLMVAAQKRAFKDGLAAYHPLFWASKLHFYLTRRPFYNFPYTFGYLFSNALYAQALNEGPAFAGRYKALLRDTGAMKTEELAKRHLGADLTRPEFWEMAVDQVLSPVDEFVALAAKVAR